MGDGHPMFELRNVSKRYGRQQAVNGISLRLERGKVHVLIGPSGCGKSTLLRLMILLVEPDAGSISFEDAPVEARNAMSVRRRVGYVVQQGGLFPHLTARENVLLVARHLRWDAKRMARRLDEIAALAHLPAPLLDKYPTQLSGGEQQRASLMRALMLDPDALLLDEPLGALDPMIRADLQRDLRSAFRQLGKTVVMVTHDLTEARYFGETITLLRSGRIVQHGTYDDLVEQPAEPFVTEFVNAQRSHWLEETT